MVAEPTEAGSEIETSSRISFAIPMRLKMRVRTMLLVRGLNYSQIASDQTLGLTAKQVCNLCTREGWAKERRILDAKEKEFVARRTELAVKQVAESIAIESEELVFGGLDLARESLAAKDARSFAQAANGVRALASVARECRTPANSDQLSVGPAMNLFFIGAPAAQIMPSEPKAVQEIESQKVSTTPIATS